MSPGVCPSPWRFGRGAEEEQENDPRPGLVGQLGPETLAVVSLLQVWPKRRQWTFMGRVCVCVCVCVLWWRWRRGLGGGVGFGLGLGLHQWW